MADGQLGKTPRSEIDTTLPFLSVKAAVSLFDDKVEAKKFRLPEKHVNKDLELQQLREELANVKLRLKDMGNEKEKACAELRDSQKLLAEMASVPCRIDTAIQTERVLDCKEGEKLKRLDASHGEHCVLEAEYEHAWQLHTATMAELASTKRDLEKVHYEIVLSLGGKDDAILSAQANVNTGGLEAMEETAAGNVSNLDMGECLINARMVNLWKQDISNLERNLVLATEELSRLRQELATAEEAEEKIVRDTSKAVASLDHAKMEIEKRRLLACSAGISANAFFSEFDMAKRDLEKALQDGAALRSTTYALQSELEEMRRELTALKEREANATAAVETLSSELCKTKSELGAQIMADQVKAAMANANHKLQAALKASEIAQANEHAAFSKLIDLHEQACMERALEADASSTCSQETPRKSIIDEAENLTSMLAEDGIGTMKSDMTRALLAEDVEVASEAEVESRTSWTKERDSMDTSTWSDTEGDTKEQWMSPGQREMTEAQKVPLNQFQSGEPMAQKMFDSRKKKKKQHLLPSMSIFLRKKSQSKFHLIAE